MLWLGYSLIILMGLTLGLIGAGGSILTLPILIYFFQIPAITATGYSLFIVGATALIGSVQYARQRRIDYHAALTFALPSLFSMIVTRKWILPFIPDSLFHLPKHLIILLLFMALMFTAAVFMLKPLKVKKIAPPQSLIRHSLKLMSLSASVGLLTGLIGAGGGFLIIPTLITLFNLDMKMAVGTSLSIIALNALLGFSTDLFNHASFDFYLLTKILGLTLIGLWLGTRLHHNLPPERLKQIFGILTLMIAAAMSVKEFLLIAYH